MKFPQFYAVIDKDLIPKPLGVLKFYALLLDAGVTFVQYRNKSSDAAEMLADIREMKRITPLGSTVVMNDRADLMVAADLEGVHLGQDDLSVKGARKLCVPSKIVGLSTHNIEQVHIANNLETDYIALGPIFATTSKANPDATVGLERLRDARKITKMPLIAIGGITRKNCQSVLDAGADCIAVISDLLADPSKSAEEFLRLLS